MAQVATVPIEVEDALSEVLPRIKNVTEDQRSSFSGATEPSNPVEGQFWLDTSATPSILKNYDGTNWNVVGLGGFENLAVATTANYAVQDSDEFVILDTSSNSVQADLPTAAGRGGKRISFLKTSNLNTATVDGNGAETLNGAANISWTNIYVGLDVVSDGTNWLVLPSGGQFVTNGLNTNGINSQDGSTRFSLSVASQVLMGLNVNFKMNGGWMGVGNLSDIAGTTKADLANAGLFDVAGGIVLRSRPASGAGEFVRHGGSVNVDATNFANTDGTEQTALTLAIDGSTLINDGDYLEFDIWGVTGVGPTTPIVRVKWGATTLITGFMDSTAANGWRATGKIIRTGAATQVGVGEFRDKAQGVLELLETAAGETLSGSVNLVVTIQDGVGTANSIHYKGSTVKWFPAASI